MKTPSTKGWDAGSWPSFMTQLDHGHGRIIAAVARGSVPRCAGSGCRSGPPNVG